MKAVPSANFFRRTQRYGFSFLVIFAFLTHFTYSADHFIPPSRPAVPPRIATLYASDKNQDRIDDRLFDRIQLKRGVRFGAFSALARQDAIRDLGAMVDVELIFDRPVTRQQIDAFIAQGGEITYLYKAVSFGWNGRVPLDKVDTLPARMGGALMVVEEPTQAVLHMDLATQAGRVRPVWADGFGGGVSGFDGSTNITVAVIDSGVDESHSDLTGRRVYWEDFTTESEPSPIDIDQHGSHVMGIAVGSGAAGGAASGTLEYTQIGDLTGVSGFFPSPIDLPALSLSFNITAQWIGPASTTLYLVRHTKGTDGGWIAMGTSTGSSPLVRNRTFTPNINFAYSPALLGVGSGDASDFVADCRVTNYPGIGDGFNRFRGVAPGCNWAGAKVFLADGSGFTFWTGAAIDDIVANRSSINAKVINLSLGTIGDPGISTSNRQKVNTAVDNGIVVVSSAGNDGEESSSSAREVDDPGRAALALTVGAVNDANELTDYTSHGFTSPGSIPGREEDYKPDVAAPGGSLSRHTGILSVDSNSGDGLSFADQQTNDYYNINGTSMASPFAAGCAALVIDALEESGVVWDFNSNDHSRFVKMVLCATASELNSDREDGNFNPTLQRATAGPNGFPVGKDRYEGYGMLNPDAAVEAVALYHLPGITESEALGGSVSARRVWARTVGLAGGISFDPQLTVPAGADFDLYLIREEPSEYGTPIILGSSTSAGEDMDESLMHTPSADTNVLIVVKLISGSGTFLLDSTAQSSISIQKDPSIQVVPLGGDASFTITVTNSGLTALSGVVVTDPSSPDCDLVIGAMAVGASTSYVCTATNVTEEFTNSIEVVATPAIGPDVSDQSAAHVDVINPSIQITQDPASQFISSGSNAVFAITITNTGDVALSNVVVNGPLSPDCDLAIATFAAGAGTSYVCTVTNVMVDFTNTISVVGSPPVGSDVFDMYDAFVDVINPSIEISKGPALQQIDFGTEAAFTITVTNSGDVALANVQITDSLASDCDLVISNLQVGATTGYLCTATNVTEDFTNTINVVASPPVGPDVVDDATAVVDVLVPSIQLHKAPALQQVLSGLNAVFTITVTNTGDVALSNVDVSDPLTPDCDLVITTLLVGASTSYVCTATNVVSDFTNTASVVATPPVGSDVSDQSDGVVDVINPSIRIALDPVLQQIQSGSNAIFTITVTNTGDVALSNVVVSDPLTPDCDLVITTFLAGASTSYVCTATNVVSNFTNTVGVVGTPPVGSDVSGESEGSVDVISPSIQIIKIPAFQQILFGSNAVFTITVTNTGDVALSNVVVSDPLVPACDLVITTFLAGGSTSYVCVATNVVADFTNTAGVVGTPPAGSDVSDQVDAIVDVINPSIQITADPLFQQILSGSNATFTIAVTNTGDVTLSNVLVSDPLVPACDLVITTLLAGASTSYVCAATNVVSDFTNTASVVGTPPIGSDVSDQIDAVVDVINPSIQITADPVLQQVRSGSNAIFTITVTNAGDVALSNVVVSDPLTPECDLVITTFLAGASTSYVCTATNVVADFTNTASVVGTPPSGPDVTDLSDGVVDVINPSIQITKDPVFQQILSGSNAIFTIAVTNTGDVALSNVLVSDPLVPACDLVITTLLAGASTSYVCTATNVVADFTNTASVVGTPPVGSDVSDQIDAVVDVINPSIQITADPVLQQILSGSNAVFTITVTNTGDVALSNVLVSDPLVLACDLVITTLLAGASTSYVCAATNVVADFTNTAGVVGTPPVGSDVSDQSDAVVDVFNPSIQITVDPVLQQIRSGSNALFTITVTNAGDVALSNVVVSDPLVPACDLVITTLLAGASTSYVCTATNVLADFTNTASVVATPPVGSDVSDQAAAVADVINPSIQIIKDSGLQQIQFGSNAVFAITVTNTGDVALSNVVVSDPLTPDCDLILASLFAGASTSYVCTATNIVSDFTNTASVVGTPPSGPDVSDQSGAVVDVINPSVQITKDPSFQQIRSSSNAIFTITVTNAGDVALSNVVVSDLLTPDCDLIITTLLAGASTSYVCTATNVVSDFTNTASVVGTPPSGPDVSDQSDAVVDVINPSIQITKAPVLQQMLSGSNAIFAITVTNAGDVALSNVVVSDPLVPDCDLVITSLLAGASTSYVCTATNVVLDFTNTANVVATAPAGSDVSDQSDAVVDVINPSIQITKNPSFRQIRSGSNAVFTITVTNAGDVALSNVVVSDPLVPACDLAITSLLAGASTSYVCTATNVVSDFTNTVGVVGTPPVGSDVSGESEGSVDVINPLIQITVDPVLQQIRPGSNAIFTITVTNTGDVALSNVLVSDPLVPACDLVITSLLAGASTSYVCTATNVVSDFTNTVGVVGTPPVGSDVSDQVDAIVDVINPSIQITADPVLQQIQSGSNAVFTFAVTNTGDVALSNVVVSDPLTPECDLVITTFLAGASTSYVCVATNVVADFTNTASVVGTPPVGSDVSDQIDAVVDVINPSIQITSDPVLQQILSGSNAIFTIGVTNTGDVALSNVFVSDPLVSACDLVITTLLAGASTSYVCTATNVVVDFTNTVGVVGTPPVGSDVSGESEGSVDVINPSIQITVDPVLQQIRSGSNAMFIIAVTNTGDVALSNVLVSDPLVPACDLVITTFLAGASTSYVCTATNVVADFTNTASVVGTPPSGPDVTDQSDGVVDVINPSIQITKDPVFQQILSGSNAIFTIAVTNTGDVALSNVLVSDPLVPACDLVITTLLAGASTSYVCAATNVLADFTNTASVVGTPPSGPDVSDQFDAVVDVFNPSIQITVDPVLQQIRSGSNAVFTIAVTNTGDVALSNVLVSDPLVPACDLVITTLLAGASTSYVCAATNVLADFTNTAGVVATPPAGSDVSDQAAAVADVINPSIQITKDPPLQQIPSGSNAIFTITVTNAGDVTLSNVVVSDPLVPACDLVITTLLAGASTSYVCTATNVLADFTNTASVVATPPVGSDVSDQSDAVVDVINPSIQITKDPVLQQILSGSNAIFAITVTNAGDVALSNVVVSDPLVPACDLVITTLLAGASTSYVCTATNVLADFTNTASVVATPPVGSDVSDQSDAVVDVINPSIQITKDPVLQQILSGSNATFTITVTNTGDVALSNVVVSDPLVPGCDLVITTFAAGASTSYICTVTNVLSDFTNIATVVGTPSAGPDAVDSDQAAVEIVVLSADLQVEKEVSPPILVSQSNLTYSITITNSGPGDALDVLITDVLPAAVEFEHSTPGAPDCVFSNGILECQIGSISAGSVTSILVEVSVQTNGTGFVTNLVSISASSTDSNLLNNAASAVAAIQDSDGDGNPDFHDLDDDNDLIPDVWEEEHSLNPLDPSDALDDQDGDGFTALEEYISYTDPFNAAAYLKIEEIDADSPVTISWSASVIRVYTVEYNMSPDLESWSVLFDDIIGSNSVISATDTNMGSGRNYRVGAKVPEP